MINSCLEKVELDLFALMFCIHLNDIPYKLLWFLPTSCGARMWGSLHWLKPIQYVRLNFTASSVKPFAQTIPTDASPKDWQVIFLWLFHHPKSHFHKWSGDQEPTACLTAVSSPFTKGHLSKHYLLLIPDMVDRLWPLGKFAPCVFLRMATQGPLWKKCDRSVYCFSKKNTVFAFTILINRKKKKKKEKEVFFCGSSPGLPGNPKKTYLW